MISDLLARIWRRSPSAPATVLTIDPPAAHDSLGAATLYSIAGRRGPAQAAIVDALGPLLEPTLARYGIDTPLRRAHFLAQAAHECDRFCTLTEYASGQAYEGRRDLGNTKPGDGRRFRGRGILQITGRANYNRAGLRLGLDLISNPELLATPGPALEAACAYWQDRVINRHADNDDLVAVTKAINGGTNGLEDRRALTGTAKRILGLG